MRDDGMRPEKRECDQEETIQTKLLRRQLFYSRFTCIAVVAFLLIFAVALLPKATRVLKNLDEVTSDLNEVDFSGLAWIRKRTLKKSMSLWKL